VAIVLSPCFYQAWVDAGSKNLFKTKKDSEFEERFIGLTLKIQYSDSNGKKSKVNS